jgi:multiple antibiotic resistance protein
MKTIALAAGETVGVLFPIVDPLGNLPTFLALTARQGAETRRTVIRTVVVAGAVLLIAFAAVGEPVLNYFGISREGLQIAGGIIVAFTGFQMITGTEQKLEAAAEGTSIALSPLVVPLLAGPGAMAAIMSLDARDKQVYLALPGIAAGVIAIFAVVFVVFTLGEQISRRLPAGVVVALNLIFGLFVMAIGVELVVHGIATHGAVVKVH